jgi:hypothetical protein
VFAVRQNLCRAFYFGRTAKSLFAVRFYIVHGKEKTHAKQVVCRAPRENAPQTSCLPCVFIIAHGKVFSPLTHSEQTKCNSFKKILCHAYYFRRTHDKVFFTYFP